MQPGAGRGLWRLVGCFCCWRLGRRWLFWFGCFGTGTWSNGGDATREEWMDRDCRVSVGFEGI
jgi:hypothetical protein